MKHGFPLPSFASTAVAPGEGCPQPEMRRGLSGAGAPSLVAGTAAMSSTSTQNCVSVLSHDVNTRHRYGLRQTPGISHFQVNNQCRVGVTQARGNCFFEDREGGGSATHVALLSQPGRRRLCFVAPALSPSLPDVACHETFCTPLNK